MITCPLPPEMEFSEFSNSTPSKLPDVLRLHVSLQRGADVSRALVARFVVLHLLARLLDHGST